jgi:hypothetical protein
MGVSADPILADRSAADCQEEPTGAHHEQTEVRMAFELEAFTQPTAFDRDTERASDSWELAAGTRTGSEVGRSGSTCG